MTPIVVIRPQPGCDATVAAARAMGLAAHGFPLFAVEPVAWSPPDPASIDALLIGSVNALRHGGPALGVYRGKPAYAVGRASAEAARAAGLEVVVVGDRGLQAVLDLAPAHRNLLRLSGEARVEVTPPAGITVVERVVYASKPLPLPAALAELLRKPAIVLLHSGEAARHFAGLCDSAGIARSNIRLAAIGPRVANAAAKGWAEVAAAQAPNNQALLALARQMCEEQVEPSQSQDKA